MIAMIRTKCKHVTIATTLFIHKTLTTRNACIIEVHVEHLECLITLNDRQYSRIVKRKITKSKIGTTSLAFFYSIMGSR